jgi:xanthine/CO dehydrogenase XdhC/CoxF family maturation factor
MTDTLTPTPDACLVAHGAPDAPQAPRSLVLIYAGEIARHLTAMAAACDYRVTVVEPDPTLRAAAAAWAPTLLAEVPGAELDAGTDVVATDHHRADLGVVLRDALAAPTRWVGVLGNPRGIGPHVQLLGELGVPEADIARVHRPVGLNIGSRQPAEIAVSTLAGLLADRAGKPGGFDFSG